MKLEYMKFFGAAPVYVYTYIHTHMDSGSSKLVLATKT